MVLLLAGKRIGEPKAGWIATTIDGARLRVVGRDVDRAAVAARRRARTTSATCSPGSRPGTSRCDIGFLADPLSVTWILLVTGVGSLIHLYAIGYMHGDARFSRFFAYLNLFAAAMLMLVLGASFLVTFLGWEGVGLCSYLLVSFWFERDTGVERGQEGVRHQPRRRLRLHDRDVLHRRRVGSLDYPR